ncbi:MAG: ABC transporter substrate-binding protein [bacterium]
MKMRMSALPAFAIALLSLFAGSACHRAAATPEDALEVAIPAGPATLDPRLATDAEGSKISSLICDGLFGLDDFLEPIPLIAESYEQLSASSYRIRIRPGVKFSDGSALAAKDVVFTFKSIIEGRIASPFKAAFQRISRIEAEDGLTVRIELSEVYAPFLNMLTRGIVSEKAAVAAGEDFGRAPLCAGPYRLLRFVPDKVVELAANDSYFGERPNIPRLNFHIIQDDNIRVLKLLKGDVDLVQNAVPRLLIKAMLKREPGLSMKEDVGIVVAYVGLNLADPLLAKAEVRRAVAYAIDREAIIGHRFRGMARPANSIISPENWAYDESLGQYPYDPAKARAMLDAAGLPDPDGAGPAMRFNLTLKTSTVKERIDIARMIAHQLGRVGIGVRVVPFEWGTFYRDIKKGNFQAYTLSWVGVTEPDIFYNVCRSDMTPPEGYNRGRYSNPEVDLLVAEGRAALSEDERKRIYGRVQQILFRDLPFIPLWYETNYVIYREGLEGVSVRPDASYSVFAKIKKP